MSRIDFTVLLLFEFLNKHHLPIRQLKKEFTSPIAKSTSRGLLDIFVRWLSLSFGLSGGRHVGLMVSVRHSISRALTLSPRWVIACFVFLAKHLTFIVPSFTQEDKLSQPNLKLGITLPWTGILSRDEQKYS